MVEDKECRKKYDKIVERKENESYTEWKAWVIEQVKSYDLEKMQNLVKRTEIQMKIAEGKSQLREHGVMAYIIPFATVLITMFATIVITVFGNLSDVYNTRIDVSVLSEYVELLIDTMLNMSTQLLSACTIIAIAYIIAGVMESAHADKNSLKKVKEKIYYEELFCILEEELERKQHGEAS